jgi:hypothetical protein
MGGLFTGTSASPKAAVTFIPLYSHLPFRH